MITTPKSAENPPRPSEPEDGVLIAEALAGSEAQFARLLERYRPLLWRVAWRMALNTDDAWEERRRRIAQALGELSPQQRTAVTLRFYEEMPLAEIAEAMECGEGSVKQHLFRAMAKLRQILESG